MSSSLFNLRLKPHWFRFPALGLVLLTLGLITSCGTSQSTGGNTATSSPAASSPATSSPATSSPATGTVSDSKKLQVVTTFLPMTQFTRAVAGDRAEVNQLLPPGAEPHDYQAKPEDVQRLAKAQVLITNGLGMENFLSSTIKNANNPNLKIVDSSRGVPTIKSEEVAGEHAHDHGNEPHANESGHEHGEFNPHIWLDPKRAIRQVENIRDALIAADPEGKAIYTANATQFIGDLKTLDAEIAAALQAYSGKTFIAYHDFAPYFAQSYRLKAEFLVDVPEENPTPADVKRVMQTAQASNLKTLLTEPSVGAEAFATVAADLKVRVSVFNPLETGNLDAMQPQVYLQTMRQNLQNLKSAFQGSITQSGVENRPGLRRLHPPLGQPLAMQHLGWLQTKGQI